MKSWPSSLRIWRILAKSKVKSAMTTNWLVKAFVEQTPISGPAQENTSISLASYCRARYIAYGQDFSPLALSSRMAAIVSAVSPDWLMAITKVLESTTGFL